MEVVNPCNEKEECFPSQGKCDPWTSPMGSPACRGPSGLRSLWSLPLARAARLLGPLVHVVPACHHPRPWEAPLQTCSLITGLCWSPSPTVGTFQAARSHVVCSGGGGRVGRETAAAKRNEARLSFWRWVFSPSQSNQNYWKHLCTWQSLRNENQACSDKESHTESKFFLKAFRELVTKSSTRRMSSNSARSIIKKTISSWLYP